MANAIEINNIEKDYGDFRLKDVSFNLERGAIMGLIGTNGAGKTTIIKAIMDLIHLDSGFISVLGGELTRDIKNRIGVV